MRIYNCKVRLAGDIRNEVRKDGATAAEIIVLRNIHGSDSVVDISPVTNDKRPHSEERARLSDEYGPERVEALFGPDHQKLPTDLPDAKAIMAGVLGDEGEDEGESVRDQAAA